MNIHTIVLAAGEGSRMKSNRAKSLQRIGGTSMLEKICLTAGSISPKITLVVGFDKDSVIKESNTYNLEISTADQPKPIGTGPDWLWLIGCRNFKIICIRFLDN